MNPTHMEKLTRFYDNSVVHKPEKETKESVSTMRPLPIQGTPVDIESFMFRPYKMSTISWASTSAIGTSLYSAEFPKNLLSTSSTLTSKLNEVAWWRPDLEFEIQINATKFHYGRLIAVIIPFSDTLSSSSTSAQLYSTWPEWYQLSPNAQQSLKIFVPYRHWIRKLSVGNTSVVFDRLFTLNIAVASPLSSAMSATVAPAVVTVYCRVVAPNMGSFAPDLSAQSGEEEALVAKGMTAVPLKSTISKVIDIVTDSNVVVSAAKDITRLVYEAGMSIPINPAPTNSMQIRMPLLAKSNDLPNTVNLGPSVSACVDKDDRTLVNGTDDDMDIVKFVSQPSILYTGHVLSTSASGTIMWQTQLNPQVMVYGDYVFTPGTDLVYGLPIYYTARMFKKWRGSFKIHISFISSAFHSCRVRFVWNPSPQSNAPSYSDLQRVNMFNVLMDINKQTDYSILIPYDSCCEWLDCEMSTSKPITSSVGHCAMYLETKLTSAVDTVQPIMYQVFISMTDDAQFAGPTLENGPTWGTPFLHDTPPPPPGLNLVAQSSEVDECELPSSSSFCLRNTKYVSIMGDNFTPRRVGGESTAFEFTSFKQLTNMLTPFKVVTTNDTDNFSGVEISPFAPITQDYKNDIYGSYYFNIRPIFRFGRGSVRIAALITSKTIQAVAYLRPASTSMAVTTLAVTDMPYLGAITNLTFSSGSQYFMDTAQMPVDIVIPYYSNTPCLPLNADGTNPDYLYSASAAVVVFSTQKTKDLKILYLIGTSDDFVFGTRIGVPVLKKFTV